jgi:hypothetical protein
MFYYIQNRLFAENEWNDLIRALESLNLEYDIVDLDDLSNIQKQKKDIFCFGAMKLAKLSEKYKWKPGVIMTPNHDFEVYSKKYKENLLNFDSLIYNFDDNFYFDDKKFIRPTKDNKFFNAKVFSFNEWKLFQESKKAPNIRIQISSVKKIKKEFRFFIVNGEIVTGSLYKIGQFVVYDSIIDNEAENFCHEMVNLFQVSDSFTMDVCLTEDNKWKILECGCINCAGLYKANIQKLIYKIEDFYTKK